jgi:NADPH:quinone reductase-like Zn-dependent oxidoreductase
VWCYAHSLAHDLRLQVKKKEDLVTLQQMADAGSIRPTIERTYPLAEAAAALAHVESGQARGKVVLTI